MFGDLRAKKHKATLFFSHAKQDKTGLRLGKNLKCFSQHELLALDTPEDSYAFVQCTVRNVVFISDSGRARFVFPFEQESNPAA